MTPGDLSNSLLDDWVIRVRFGEGTHVHQVRPREPAHVGELSAQIVRQPLDHLRSPAFVFLADKDLAANVPIELKQFAIDREAGAYLSSADSRLQLIEEVSVAGDLRGVALMPRGQFASLFRRHVTVASAS